MRHIHFPTTDSTNARAKEIAGTSDERIDTLVSAAFQTAGRGQRGNSWESDPDANALFSLLYYLVKGAVPAVRQFLLSKAIAIAIVEVLAERYVDSSRHSVKIKWPNDIYVDDRKIAGILIEHSLNGAHIDRTVIGVGINVNQPRFLSDAPNPVSLAMLRQEDGAEAAGYDPAEIISLVVSRFYDLVNGWLSGSNPEAIGPERYYALLWRNDGRPHPFSTPDGQQFSASIQAIDDMGVLTLRMPDGSPRTFRFKEVAFTL